MNAARRFFRGCGLLAGGLFVFQAPSAPTTGALVERLNAASTAPMRVAPQPMIRSDMIWVPDRYVPTAGQSTPGLVPGHWERQVSDREVYVPPLSVVDPTGATRHLAPGRTALPADSRVGP